MYLATSLMHSLQQYYNTAYTEEQRITLTKEFMRATADAINAVVFAADALFCDQRREIDELRAKVEQPNSAPKPTPPAPVIADVKISKDSLQQMHDDLIKALQK